VLDVLGFTDGPFFCNIYDVTPGGNWEGMSIPNRLRAQSRLPDGDEQRLAAGRARLLERRSKRVRPGLDDKVLADWNGLLIAALAFAGVTFRRPEWTALAARAFGFVTTAMTRDGRLAHSWRGGKSVFPGIATDYAATVKAALALHAATLDPAYLATAEALAAALRPHHWDAGTPGYFLPADDAAALIVRPRAATDEATPSATGLMAQNLIRLWRLTGKDGYRRDADDILATNAGAVAENLFATASLLSALDFRMTATDVVIVAPAGAEPEAMLRAVRERWTPGVVLSVHTATAALPAGHPAAGKGAVEGKATAYVCRGETCSLPVTEAEGLKALLGSGPALPPA
jgi:uncharacterized protein YyaL (SSP411 family)